MTFVFELPNVSNVSIPILVARYSIKEAHFIVLWVYKT